MINLSTLPSIFRSFFWRVCVIFANMVNHEGVAESMMRRSKYNSDMVLWMEGELSEPPCPFRDWPKWRQYLSVLNTIINVVLIFAGAIALLRLTLVPLVKSM